VIYLVIISINRSLCYAVQFLDFLLLKLIVLIYNKKFKKDNYYIYL